MDLNSVFPLPNPSGFLLLPLKPQPHHPILTTCRGERSEPWRGKCHHPRVQRGAMTLKSAQGLCNYRLYVCSSQSFGKTLIWTGKDILLMPCEETGSSVQRGKEGRKTIERGNRAMGWMPAVPRATSHSTCSMESSAGAELKGLGKDGTRPWWHLWAKRHATARMYEHISSSQHHLGIVDWPFFLGKKTKKNNSPMT